MVSLLLLLITTGTCLAQFALPERESCTVRFAPCTLRDGTAATCYDDKDLVNLFCGSPENSSCTPFPFQCGWDISSDKINPCAAGAACRINGRAGVCGNRGRDHCIISDTTCENGDRWCFRGGVGGVCDAEKLVCIPATGPPTPIPPLSCVQVKRVVVPLFSGQAIRLSSPDSIPIVVADVEPYVDTAPFEVADAAKTASMFLDIELFSERTSCFADAEFRVTSNTTSVSVELLTTQAKLTVADGSPRCLQEQQQWTLSGVTGFVCPSPPGTDPCGFLQGSTSRQLTESSDSSSLRLTESSCASTLSVAVTSALLAPSRVVAPVLLVTAMGCLRGAMAQTSSCDAYVRVRLAPPPGGRFAPTPAECATTSAGPSRIRLLSVEANGVEKTIGKRVNPPGCYTGRPFIARGDSIVVSNASASTDDERAGRWVSQGLGEHASVASFAAFSLQLMVNGAPFSLLSGAAKANADEVRHAEQSFALASRFAGHPITAEPFPRHAISSLVPQSLEELAEAAFREGCIAETLSVFAAARQVDENHVVDDEERAVLTGIVRDEARHSALAWRTVAWATATAKNAALNAKLMQIAVDESNRCVATHSCDVFARLIVPLSKKLIGTSDWQRVVESDDVAVEIDPSRTLTARTIEALIQTF
jgi:hypothetical protein